MTNHYTTQKRPKTKHYWLVSHSKHRHDGIVRYSLHAKETKTWTRPRREWGSECVKIESQRLDFTLSKSSLWDSISTCSPRRNRVSETRFLRGVQVEIEFQTLDFYVENTWNFGMENQVNRALEARVVTITNCLQTGPTNWIVSFLMLVSYNLHLPWLILLINKVSNWTIGQIVFPQNKI